MIHELWNILERKGYKVAGEVKVVPDETYDKIWQSKPTLEKIKPYIDDSGNIRFKTVRGISTTIDLVATDGERFIGFEVKDDFDDVVDCISKKQLEHYIAGGTLDEIYLVVPVNEAEHVKESYGHYLESIGVGLIALDENYNPIYILESFRFQRMTQPSLERNEAWLKHVLWNYFESKFDVEGEAVIPKPWEAIEKYQFKKASNPNRYLQRIDLFLLPKGYSITDVAYNQDKLDAIGIEVKYGIKKRSLRTVISQLNSYANSGALTRLYLAVDRDDGLVEKIQAMKDRKFGLMIYRNGEVETVLESPKLKIKYDKLAFQYPSGNKIDVYEFGKPTDDHLIEDAIKQTKCYCIIYVRLSRKKRSHVIDIIRCKDYKYKVGNHKE